METLSALQARKSVRSYLDREVEKDKLDRILAAGNHAPNAGPFHVTVIRDRAYLAALDAAALEAMKNSGNDFLMRRASLPGYRPLYGAPILLLLSAPEGPYAMANVSCAATAMTVAAADLGLGSCYVVTPTLALKGGNTLDKNVTFDQGKAIDGGALLDILKLPEGCRPLCGVLLGYAGEETVAPPPAGKADNVTFI